MNKHGTENLRRVGEASRWLAQLRDAPDDATVTGWLRWCEQDPANVHAYEDAQRLWRQFDQVCDERDDAVSLLLPSARSRWERPGEAGLVRRYFAIAAAIALLAFGTWRFIGQEPPTSSKTVTAITNRTTVLPDGSTLALGAKTTVAMNFSGERRVLELSPGQAYFNVQPDKQRPFVVMAGELKVTAIGTAFDVKHEPSRIVVTVQEGVVAVVPSDEGGLNSRPHPNSWRVGAGYQFIYSVAEATTTLSSVDTSAVLAWRDGRLEYVRTPLASVLVDLNRYAGHPIEISDAAEPALARLTFTGTVFTDSIDDWIAALPGALPVRVERTASGRIFIHAGPASLK